MRKEVFDRLVYSVNIDIDVMRDEDMSDDDIVTWFNTQQDDEDGYNGYLDEIETTGEYSIDELNYIVKSIIVGDKPMYK